MRLLALREQLRAGVGWILVATGLCAVLLWLVAGPRPIDPGVVFPVIALALSAVVPTRYFPKRDDSTFPRDHHGRFDDWDDHYGHC